MQVTLQVIMSNRVYYGLDFPKVLHLSSLWWACWEIKLRNCTYGTAHTKHLWPDFTAVGHRDTADEVWQAQPDGRSHYDSWETQEEHKGFGSDCLTPYLSENAVSVSLTDDTVCINNNQVKANNISANSAIL